MLIVLSVNFVNKNDNFNNYASLISEIPEYDTVACHGGEYSVYIYNNEGVEIEYSPRELANMIRNSTSYKGKSIRLISCKTGSRNDGFAQQLANEMNVNVLAPTEDIWVNSYGKLFISDNSYLADMWYTGKGVNETGKWRLFKPQKGVAHD